MRWRCLFGHHDWIPRSVTGFVYAGTSSALPRTVLLEVCPCGARRETEWHGRRELSDFARPLDAKSAAEELIQQTRTRVPENDS